MQHSMSASLVPYSFHLFDKIQASSNVSFDTESYPPCSKNLPSPMRFNEAAKRPSGRVLHSIRSHSTCFSIMVQIHVSFLGWRPYPPSYPSLLSPAPPKRMHCSPDNGAMLALARAVGPSPLHSSLVHVQFIMSRTYR